MVNENKPLVVIVARNPLTALSMVRAVGESGYTADMIAVSRRETEFDAVLSSKYVRNSVEIVSLYQQDDGERRLIDELLNYKNENTEKIVLLTTDNYTASVIDENRTILEDTFLIQGTEEGTLSEYLKKTKQSELAEQAGFQVADEWEIMLDEGSIKIPEDMVYPCFCKAIIDTNKNKQDTAICSDEDELREYVYEMRRRPKRPFSSVLVQEYLEIDKEISVAGVCEGGNVIMPAMISKAEYAEFNEDHTLTGKIMSSDTLGEVKERIEKLIKGLNYTGLFEVELNVVNDKIYFNDFNLCGSVLNDAYMMSGINLPGILTDLLTGKQPEDGIFCEQIRSFVNGEILWNDFSRDLLTKAEYDDYINSADMILSFGNEEDPVPQQVYKELIKQKIRRRNTRRFKRAVQDFIKSYVFPPLRKVKYIMMRYPQAKKKNMRNPDSEYPRVVVIGRNYCSNLCMAKAVGEAGYEVEVLRVFQRKPRRKNIMKKLQPDAYSKYVKAYHVCVSRRSVRIANRLKALADPDRRMLLIPTDDFTSHVTDSYYEDLKEFYHIPNINDREGEINRLMSKDAQKELALKAGLPVLGSCVIRTENGEFEIPESVAYPCFIKPNISKNGSKTKMRKCDNEQELYDALKEISEERDVEMLVEDYVEIAREYSLLGVSMKDKAIGPGFFVAEEGGEKEHRGVAVIGKVLPCSKMQELIDELITFVGSLNYEGLYDVDLIETADGKVYFVELNVRFGGSGHAITKSGVNLPGMYADYILQNKPVDMDAKVEEPGKRFISEKILIEEYAKGRMDRSKVKSSMDSADIHFIKDKNDPRPYRHFRKFYFAAALLGAVHKMRGDN